MWSCISVDDYGYIQCFMFKVNLTFHISWSCGHIYRSLSVFERLPWPFDYIQIPIFFARTHDYLMNELRMTILCHSLTIVIKVTCETYVIRTGCHFRAFPCLSLPFPDIFAWHHHRDHDVETPLTHAKRHVMRLPTVSCLRMSASPNGSMRCLVLIICNERGFRGLNVP
jgi:hypothetical protein